jgi:hypothetical protein
VTAAVCAVMAGYRSYTAIAEWVADVPDATILAVGIAWTGAHRRAMIRRLLQVLDPDLLTTAIARLACQPRHKLHIDKPPGDRGQR